AKVGGLIGKIADLGISGAAQYQSARSIGVLQQDLKDAIQNGNSCKLEVFKTLEHDLIRGRTPDAGERVVNAPEPPHEPPAATPMPRALPSWCPRASTQIEQLVCRTDRLAALDLKLTAAYQNALSRTAPAQQPYLRREENDWIQQRNACVQASNVLGC